MEVIDINTWKRKQHYHHFRTLKDPFFGIVFSVDVTKAHTYATKNKVSLLKLDKDNLPDGWKAKVTDRGKGKGKIMK